MEDTQRKDSSSVSLKEKTSLLDMDIGKDFLSNWNSMSMAEGDGMDFDLTPVSKGNKKSFSFGKADMDFNLDGDFGKMSSFNMDMSDLDISPPLKKDGKSNEKSKESFNMDIPDLDMFPQHKRDVKSKERPKESSSGKDKGKADHFGFAFDFDELENFSFGSKLTKEGSKVQKDKDNKESSPSESGCQAKESSMDLNLIGNISISEDRPQKPSLPEPMIPIDVDLEPKSKNCTSKLAEDDAVTSKHSAANDEFASDKAKKTPTETTIASREITKTRDYEKSNFVKSIDHEACTGNDAMQELSSDSLANNEPSRGNSSGALDKTDSVDQIATASNGEQDINVHSVDGSNCNYNPTVTENSQHLETVAISKKNNGKKSHEGIECHVVENTDNKETTDLGPVNPHVKNTCITSTVSRILSDSRLKNRAPASEIIKLPSVSKPADPFSSEKESERGRERLVTSLRTFIQSEKLECPGKKVSTQTTVSSLSSKKMGFTQNSRVEGRRDWTSIQSDNKLASLPLQQPKTLSRKELSQVQSQESYKSLNISREVHKVDGLEKRMNLNDSPTTQNKDMVNRTALRQIETSVKDVDTLSSSMEINKKTARNSDNPTTLASLPTINNSLAEEDKHSSFGGGKKTPDLPGLKLSNSSMEINKKTARNSDNPMTLASLPTINNNLAEEDKHSSFGGGKKTPDLHGLKLSNLNLDSTKSPIRKDIEPIGSISQKTVLLRDAGINTSRFGDLQKQSHSTLSMKRKASEEYTANTPVLHPFKRPFQSPTTSRNFVETSQRVFDKKVPNHSSIEADHIKSALGNSPVSTSDIPLQTKIKEVEISFSIENDTNIKQAEAYTKELDDLCNMLRKKQEEAKETLVQAIVNSNKLLMLNYPILEEKIRATQSLFAGLTLNSVRG